MPTLSVDLGKIATNVAAIGSLADSAGIHLAGVTKGVCGDPRIAATFLEGGLDTLADSRLDNLYRIRRLPGKRMLLRLPAISEANDVVELADVSLVSQIETAKALSSAALLARSHHEVILMLEMGDLREGIFDEGEFERTLLSIERLPGVRLAGIGANFCCMYGVRPTPEKMMSLEKACERAETILNRPLDILSGGNSSNLHLLAAGSTLGRVNQLRVGEAFLTGRETAYGSKLPGTEPDAFSLAVEIIELNTKPTIPYGDIGLNSFGEQPSFVDRGRRKRVICNIGRQDVDLDQISPLDTAAKILGGSSDHMIVDIEDSSNTYRVGSKMGFSMKYGGILGLMSSPDVAKLM